MPVSELNWVSGVVVLAGMAVLLAAKVVEDGRWEEVHVSYGDTSPTLERHAFLQQQGVRCKLGQSVAGGRARPTPVATLLVLRHDAQKARRLLAERFPG